MGRTFVTIDRTHGFWVNDWYLELCLRLLLLHLEHSPDENSPCHAIRQQWHLASTGFFNGCVPHSLKEAVSTEEGRSGRLRAIHSLTTALENAPAILNKDVINLLWADQYCEWNHDVDTQYLLQVAYALLGLVEGGISTTVITSDGLPRRTLSHDQLPRESND